MDALRSRGGPAALVLAALLLALGVGWLVPQTPLIALAAAGAVLLLGLVAVDAALVPLLFLPLLYVTYRVGGGGVDLSVSDLALGLGTIPALVFARRPYSRPMRQILWFTAIYQTSTLFTVIANPYLANGVEWVHAWFLIGGALIYGWAIGRGGHGRTGMLLLLATACVLSLFVVARGLISLAQGTFGPVELGYGMQKNFLGTVLAMTALIAYVRPRWLQLQPHLAAGIFWLLAAAVGFTQSRQAIIALGIVLAILVLRSNTDRRRSKLILLVVIPAAVVVGTLVQEQSKSGNQFNSYFQRLTWFGDAIEIWSTRPLVGVGLRYWYTGRYPAFQPPNAEIEVLASAGLIGLAGFVVLMIGCVGVLWRVPPAYGILAVLAVLSRFIQGQFDLFWVASQCSIPFVIAGICLGVQALHDDEGGTLLAQDATMDGARHPGATAGAVSS